MRVISNPINGLKGEIDIPGDKSISHRALMLGALAKGKTEIKGLLESQDVLCTAQAMKQLGASVEKTAPHCWTIEGATALKAPKIALDMGNAGTGARLLMGLISSYPFQTHFTGDESLCSRPMRRVTEPLSKSGAIFKTSQGDTLPLSVTGAETPTPYTHVLEVASAQVKSAVLLSGLNIEGSTTLIEPFHLKSRDHTERMLKGFGADLDIIKDEEKKAFVMTLKGKPSLKACKIEVPKDISSAAFFIVGALITKNSDILLKNIGINPLRAGIIPILQQMGGDISYQKVYDVAGEEVADIRVKSSCLKGVEVCADVAPSLIDEYPILSIAAAFAQGETLLKGLDELKVKESNRFEAIIEGLNKNGIKCEAEKDKQTDSSCIRIFGKEKNTCGGGVIQAKLDHRIAMSFLVMGLASSHPVEIDDISSIQTSFPNFIDEMNQAGAKIDDNCN